MSRAPRKIRVRFKPLPDLVFEERVDLPECITLDDQVQWAVEREHGDAYSESLPAALEWTVEVES